MVLSPNILKYQFLDENFSLNISDQCCKKIKEEPVAKWQKENNKTNVILGLRKEEGGRRESVKCVAFKDRGISFSPLAIVSNEWQKWFIENYNIKLSDLYYPPYNFERTGCIGCPYNINLNRELETLRLYLSDEYNQANILWRPVYEEYRKIGYRLKKEEQTRII